MTVINAIKVSRKPATGFLALGLFWGVFAALVPELKTQLSASDARFGTLLLGSSLGLFIAALLAPRLDLRLGDRGMQIALIGLGIVGALTGIVTGQVIFFVSLLCVGFTSGLLDIIMNTRVSDLEDATGQSMMNANHGVFSAGYAIGAVITGITREAGIGTGPSFTALGVVLVFLSLFLRMRGARHEQDTQETWVGFPYLPVLLCGLIAIVGGIAETAVESWSAIHIERTLNGSAAQGALGPAMLGLTMAIGRFSGQWVMAKTSINILVSIALVLSAVGALATSLAPTPFVAQIGLGVLGLGISVLIPSAYAMATRFVGAANRARVVSSITLMAFASVFLSPFYMGYSAEYFGLRISFAGVALFLTLALPLPFIIDRVLRRRVAVS